MYHSTEGLSNLGPKIRNLVPDKLKELVDIHPFEKEIKKWKPEDCPCRLCKTYIPHVDHKKLSNEGSFNGRTL